MKKFLLLSAGISCYVFYRFLKKKVKITFDDINFNDIVGI